MCQIVPTNRLSTLFLQCIYLNLCTDSPHLYIISSTLCIFSALERLQNNFIVTMCASAYLTAEICLTLLLQVTSEPAFEHCYFTKERAQLQRSSWCVCVSVFKNIWVLSLTFFLVKRLLISLEILSTGWFIHEYLHLLRWMTPLPFSPTTQMVLFTREDTIVSGFLRHVLTVGL